MVFKRYTTVIIAALLLCIPAAAAHSEELPPPRIMQTLTTGAVPETQPLPDVTVIELPPPPTHGFNVEAAIQTAYSEVGTARATGWNGEGECIMSVKRWVTAGGAAWTGGGTPTGNYAGATAHPVSEALPGDVIQYLYTGNPDIWTAGIHTVLVTAVNDDGTLGIVESNNPAGSGLVTATERWIAQPPPGFTAVAYRF